MEFQRVRLVRSDVTNPWDNLAREEQLVNLCEEDEAILYLWQNAHTVVCLLYTSAPQAGQGEDL